MSQSLSYFLNQTADGWFFSFNEDGSDAIGPFDTEAEADAAVSEAIAASLADIVSLELFGA
jgi:hypothetical protein